MAILVYTNTRFLIPYLLNKNRVVLYLVGVVCLMALYTYFRTLNEQYWNSIVWPSEIVSTSEHLKWNIAYAVWFTIISSMLYYTQSWYEQRQQVKNIEINQLQTELKYLRSQINPHFLFNGLNTIYGNIDQSNSTARNILVKFSDLLRYNLYEADVNMVTIEKELNYIQNYVSLQQARSDENLKIELSIDVKEKHRQIAPLLFIPFLENAFKYTGRDSENQIVRILIKQNDDKLVFECSNSYDEQESKAGGIGISNVKRRLELIYAKEYSLELNKDSTLYNVQLILPI